MFTGSVPPCLVCLQELSVDQLLEYKQAMAEEGVDMTLALAEAMAIGECQSGLHESVHLGPY